MTRWLLVGMLVALASGAGCGKKKADSSKPGETSQPVEATEPAEGAPAARAEPTAGENAPQPSAESGGQSFTDGMKALCNPEIDRAASPSERQMKTASWVKEHVSNPEVILLFQSMAELPPADREEAMDRAIAKAGLTKCPIAGK